MAGKGGKIISRMGAERSQRESIANIVNSFDWLAKSVAKYLFSRLTPLDALATKTKAIDR